jgi:hypothetical protein
MHIRLLIDYDNKLFLLSLIKFIKGRVSQSTLIIPVFLIRLKEFYYSYILT